MKEWAKIFWDKHGERLIYAFLALSIAVVMYQVDLKKEANTIIIGVATLFVNKMRSGNGAPTPEVPKTNEGAT